MDDTERALQLCEEAIALGRSQPASYDTIAKLYHHIAAAQTKKGDIPSALDIDDFVLALKTNFHQVTVNRGLKHSYLGIKIVMKEDGIWSIRLLIFLKILVGKTVGKKVNTPIEVQPRGGPVRKFEFIYDRCYA